MAESTLLQKARQAREREEAIRKRADDERLKQAYMEVGAPPAPTWPGRLGQQALRGPIGDLVHLIEPHSEADPVALLFQSLVAFGSVVGRGPHYRVESDEHHGNEFAVLVGESAKARKGTSWSHVRRVFEAVDPEWARDHITGGLSSGEGLTASYDAWLLIEPMLAYSAGCSR